MMAHRVNSRACLLKTLTSAGMMWDLTTQETQERDYA